jgi:cytochrome c-type biogenesis protein CcmH
MIGFLALALVMALLTLALLTWPLWRRGVRAGGEPSQQQAREQLQQIEALRASGALADDQAAQARVALEQRIAGTTPAPSDSAVGGSRLLVPALSLFVLLVVVAGYAGIGAPQALDPAVRQARNEGDHAITIEQIQAMADKLAARLKEQPDDAQGWAMLGRSYAVLGRQAESLPAFKQAMTLKPDDPVLIADYADALAVANNRNLEGEPLKLIERALALDPNNLKALSLAGTAAFFRKDYALALRHWEKMAQVDPNSDFVRQIQPGIDEARRLAGGAPAGAQAQTQTAQADVARTSVSGTVTLSAALAKQAAPEDTVFVFARAVEGPRVPLAILRKQVKDLPLTFALDDTMAMTPAARVSSVDKLIVAARISKGGGATPQPGDLQGQSAPVAPGARGVAVEIGQVVGR